PAVAHYGALRRLGHAVSKSEELHYQGYSRAIRIDVCRPGDHRSGYPVANDAGAPARRLARGSRSTPPAFLQPLRRGVYARPARVIRFQQGTGRGTRLYGIAARRRRVHVARRLVFGMATRGEGAVGYTGAHAWKEGPFGARLTARGKSGGTARERIRAKR